MAQTTLLSSITKSTEYPVEVSISAENSCGTVIVKYNTPYTEQMFYELPTITINIYLDDVLYESRAISLEITDENIAVGNILMDIPSSCKFSIIPNFDNSALSAHNDSVISGLSYPGQTIEQYNATLPEDATPVELWETPTETFPITLVWDDTNVSATGGGGGGSSDPTSASDVTYSNSSSGLDADNVQGAIDELADEKLDSAPNGTTDLIDGSGVIDPTYLPDYLLGQVIYGGNVSTNAVATLTTAAQHKLGTTDATITLTNDATAITGYEANEGIYYIADADFTFASMDIKTGDWLISTGTKWSKVDNTDSVTGVKGDSEYTYRTGNVNITKADIGLGNVNNTSDLNKPISTATQTALDDKFNNSDIVILTKSQYDDVGTSKFFDDKFYLISDYNYSDGEIEPPQIFGYKIDTTIANSSDAVSYVDYNKQAVTGITPAKMGTTTFDYGSWENAFFMPKPCVVHPDGYVNYYLDPNDYTKKIDGTASDLTGTDGNVMMEWGKLWYKFEQDGTNQYFFVSNAQIDNTFHCWCNIDSNNNEIDHFYMAAYNGVTIDDKLCSVSGITLNQSNAPGISASNAVHVAQNNNTSSGKWHIDLYSDRQLINSLLVLIGKSINTQSVFGNGISSTTSKRAYTTGNLNDKGLFYGSTSNYTSAVKVFGIENWYGCVSRWVAGCVTDSSRKLRIKLTYGTADGSTVNGYNFSGDGYLTNGSTLRTQGFIKTMSYNSYGYAPKAVGDGATASTYYGDYNMGNTTVCILLAGGGMSLSAATNIGAFTTYLTISATVADEGYGACLSYKPQSQQ